ncbi:SGF29 tudor-like domain-containing protein, partial [Thamnocephalis sphaerospora]
SHKHILPIGNGGSAHTGGEFPAGHIVLALYPNTTCFYKASVIVPPSKVRDPRWKGQYVVRFEDDNGQDQAVPSEMVLEFPR